MSVKVKNVSRLNFGTVLYIDGFEFWDLLQLPTVVPQPDDQFYTVLGPDRIDLLAYKFYGNAVLWWVIALANNLELLPTDMNAGDTLRIPSQRYVQKLMLQNAVSSGGVVPQTPSS